MLDALIVPLFVTADLPPRADLTEFGELLTETARSLERGGVSYEAFLAGRVFWLDQPVPPAQRPAAGPESSFAALLGHLAASGSGHTARDLVADVRRAIGAAVTVRYGDVEAPAVFAIRDRDVRERTPETARYVDTRDAPAELVSAARPYL
jgi:hypothetical protein